MSRDITIALCTFNRADNLRIAIESIVGSIEQCPAVCELLVIDNNSTDCTREVVAEFASRFCIRYIFEGRQGLSYARNRSMEECNTGLLLFTDDDVIVDKHWVREYHKASILYPDAGFFGGRILVGWPEGKPGWLVDEDLPLLSGILDKYDLGLEARGYRPEDPLPYGGSFALRRILFRTVGQFRGDLGVSGTNPGRGEESEYLERAVRLGFNGVYVGTAFCHHQADLRRLRIGHLYRYGFHCGVAEVQRQRSRRADGSYIRSMLFCLRGLLQLVKGRGDRFRQCVINAGIQVGLRQAVGKD